MQDLSTRANSCLTSMTCDQVAGNIVVAGFGDGGLRVYDRRLAPRDNMVRRYTGVHSSWVQNVHMQRGGNRELVTAEYAGQFLYPPSSRCSVDQLFNFSQPRRAGVPMGHSTRGTDQHAASARGRSDANDRARARSDLCDVSRSEGHESPNAFADLIVS